MFNFKKKIVSDQDFVTLHDCLNNVRYYAKYDEFDMFRKNALKIDEVMNGVDRKNYAMVIRKLVLYDYKWEVCFTEPETDMIKGMIDAILSGETASPLTLGRSLIKAIRTSNANTENLYERFLDTMTTIAGSTLPATMGDRTIIVDGNRTSVAGNGFPHCFIDIEAFISDGRCAIPVWADGLKSRIYGLAVYEH